MEHQRADTPQRVANRSAALRDQHPGRGPPMPARLAGLRACPNPSCAPRPLPVARGRHRRRRLDWVWTTTHRPSPSCATTRSSNTRRGARDSRHRQPHPLRGRPPGRPPSNFWRDGANPRGAVAAHHVGQLPHGRTRVGRADRYRRSGRGRRRKLVWAGADVIEPDPTLALISSARRCRRHRGTRAN